MTDLSDLSRGQDGAPQALAKPLADLAPAAVRKLGDLLDSPQSATALGAAKLILALNGFVPPSAPSDSGVKKQLAELTPDELKAMVNRVEGELAARARIVNAPKPADKPAEGAGMLD